MENNDWVKTMAESELKDGVPAVVEVEGKKVLLAAGDDLAAYGWPATVVVPG